MNNSLQKTSTGKEIIYFSRSLNSPSGHGGDKRTAQVCDILDRTINYQFLSVCDAPFVIPPKLNELLHNHGGYFQTKRSQYLKQKFTNGKFDKWSLRFRDHLLYLHLQAKYFIESLDKKPELLIVDDPVFVAPLVLYAKEKGIPLLAFSQNVETLSREQVEYGSQRELFTYELELFSKCDLVVTISQEETWLLRNFGLDPVYLPYFPIKQAADRCTAVRMGREGSTKADFLLMGTVGNLPTLEGMKRVIAAIAGTSILADDRLIIAGYGTMQLAGFVDDPRIELRGDLSAAELDELLTTTKGCIVYQENASGALTKLPELLLAGVPVILNPHAARSHHNLPGIFEFEKFEQLGAQMEAAANCGQFPHVLSPPDTTSLQKRILDLLK